MEEFIFRNATIDDIPFLVGTIIEAEKSSTQILSYTEIFGLSEDETRQYISKMFMEEIDGCEFSISSFLIAEKNGEAAASIGAWVEGSEGISSAVLKGNLLNFILPKKCIERAVNFNKMLRELNIEYVPESIQIGVVYVSVASRGKNLVPLLIDKKLTALKENNPDISEAFVQVFSNNLPAIKAYEKAGFSVYSTKESSNKSILTLLPSDKKILMRRELSTTKII